MKDNFYKTAFGIGYRGNGKYTMTNKCDAYNTWYNMLKRCYFVPLQETIKPTYIGCTVVDEWHNFQNFAEWFFNNRKYIDFRIDKDILIKGNKIYGPETCCFVPTEINSLFAKSNKIRGIYPIGVHKNKKGKFVAQLKKFGKQVSLGCFSNMEQAFQIYKINKEFYIKQVANIWKEKINENVYKALINYEVEITD